MLVPKKASASRVTLLAILIVIILAVSGYVIYTRFIQTDKVVDISNTIEVRPSPDINTDFSSDFISQAPYTDLVQNGKLPVQTSVTGRSNPFAEILLGQ